MSPFNRLGWISPAIALSALLGTVEVGRAQAPDRPEAITDEQRVRVEKHVLSEGRPSAAAPGGFAAAVGGTLPPGVELFWMSPAVELNHYRYAVVEGRTLIVAPYTRQIVAVLE